MLELNQTRLQNVSRSYSVNVRLDVRNLSPTLKSSKYLPIKKKTPKT